MNTFSSILATVTENGRVQSAETDGYFDRESLIIEVEYEAQERGLSEAETAEAVAFALDHSRNC